jgi:predicted dehydrogenase
MGSDAIRVLLVGTGVRGRHWLRALGAEPRCRVTALADPNADNLARAATLVDGAAQFSNLDEALAHAPVDVVILATPPDGHRAQCGAIFARGLPVLCEKPLTLDFAEAVAIVREAEQLKARLTVGLNFRYLGVTQATLALLREGQLGQTAFALFEYVRQRDGRAPNINKYPLTMEQPMLWEQSIHHFDLMRFCYQSDVKAVQATTWNPPWSMYRSDSNVAAIFEFQSGLIANYFGTWQAGWNHFDFQWRTDCTEGVIVQRQQFGELFSAPRTAPDLVPVPLPPHEDWFTDAVGLLDAFLTAVLSGAPMPCDGADHLKSLALVVACIESSTAGQRIQMSDLYTRYGVPTTWL